MQAVSSINPVVQYHACGRESQSNIVIIIQILMDFIKQFTSVPVGERTEVARVDQGGRMSYRARFPANMAAMSRERKCVVSTGVLSGCLSRESRS
jgi:hypothetical protein